MNEGDLITRLLGMQGEDAGCDTTLLLVGEYVEGELEGRAMAELMPAVAGHVSNCRACSEVYEGLLALIREEGAVE